jgi:hypothetical protein
MSTITTITETVTSAATHVVASGDGIDPGVTPSLNAPWIQNFLQTFAGQIAGTGIVVFVITAVIGAIVWAGSKMFGASGGQSMGLMGVIISLVGALVVGYRPWAKRVSRCCSRRRDFSRSALSWAILVAV